MTPSLVTAAPIAGPSGQWIHSARGGVVLQVDWSADANGTRVVLQIRQIAGPGALAPHAPQAPQKATLGLTADTEREGTWRFGSAGQPVEITLGLNVISEGAQLALWANLPLSGNEYFDAPIGKWLLGAAPTPAPVPDPVPLGEDRTVIEALPGAAELFPLVWLRALTPAERRDVRQRYMTPVEPSALPLYNKLTAVANPDAAAAKRQIATAFRADPAFITSVATQPAPIAGLPAMHRALLATEGMCSLEQLQVEAALWLGQPVVEFLAGPVCLAARQDVWQSLFVLALTGTAGDATLGDSLLAVLRVIHYLEPLAAGHMALEDPEVRRRWLRATAALPDATTAAPLLGSVTTPGAGSTPAQVSQWCLLGVGEVERARQQLLGYAAGELAEVVNLMARERQERHERSVDAHERRDAAETEHRRHDARVRHSDAASEFADTLREALSTDSLVRNLSNVTPSYGNLNMMLTGIAADAAGQACWDGNHVAGLVQRLSERAAQQVAERMSGQRQAVWREWRERRESQCIDNREGKRLIGIYRWIDRVVQIGLQPQGRRLVLWLQIASPAAAWVTEVAAQGPVPLVTPVPLALFAAPNGQGYAQITPTNYQALGAQYGVIDLPPPPPDPVAVTAQVGRVTVADASLLRVPEGYQVASGSATVALASTDYGLAASVGGTALPLLTAASPVTISVTVPAALPPPPSAQPAVTPPAAATAFVATTTFQSTDAVIGLRGSIPITVMSDAPLFGLSVELCCTRITLTDPVTQVVVDPLLVDWQMRVHARLWAAWLAQYRAYEAELDRRVSAASAGRCAEVQRRVLQQGALALLAQTSATADAPVLAGLLDWPNMSWHYDAPVTGGVPPWPRETTPETFTEPADSRLFRRFLAASEAQILLPVSRQAERALLYALQWQAGWAQPPFPAAPDPANIPVVLSTVAALEEQADAAGPPAPPRHWTLRLPLPLIYLQDGDALPRFDSLLSRPFGDAPELA